MTQGEQPGDSGAAGATASADQPSATARRAWLVGGVHVFTIDPRRRLGGHREARRLLAADQRSVRSASGVWRDWVSALQRHTVNSGLARLSAAERQVVTLAYLEGRTNQQIAEVLGVSVSTVRRRLVIALERLDEYVRNTGTWLSSILLAGLAYVVGHAAKVGRLSSVAGSMSWTDRLVAALAVGAVTVAALGVAGGPVHSSIANTSPHPLTARSYPRALVEPVDGLSGLPPKVARLVLPAKSPAKVALAAADVEPSASAPKPGCRGNPTSAPPRVPVGPRLGHPTGSPVSHPTAGGCRSGTA